MINAMLHFDDESDPLDGEEFELSMDEREEFENQRLAELFGPKPGRWETEWNI